MEDTSSLGPDRPLLRSLLDHGFWQAHRGRLDASLFEGEAKLLFRSLAGAHERYGRDIGLHELAGLVRSDHPTLPYAARDNVRALLEEISAAPPLGTDVAIDLLRRAERRRLFTQVAEEAIRGAHGQHDDFSALRNLLDRAEQASAEGEGDGMVRTPSDLDAILEALEARPSWRFNIPALAERLPGMSEGELLVLLARPDVGKSAFPVSSACAPGGWCEQGARVAIFCNEEPGIRTKLRAVCAAVGKPVEWVRDNRDLARQAWARIRDRLDIWDGATMRMAAIQARVKADKPDIVVLDQADKVRVEGKHDAPHQRLRQVYTEARELAKSNHCLVVAVGQASIEAEGRTTVTYAMAEESKTGKGAEGDVVLGIGARAQGNSPDLLPDWDRFLTASKNKKNGWKGTVVCTLDAPCSTYRA